MLLRTYAVALTDPIGVELVIMETAERTTRRPRLLAVPRLVSIVGGTTTLTDCLVAVRYMLTFHRLVRGPAIAEYEKAFARKIGVRYAYSFSSGRIGLYGILQALGIGMGDEVLLQVPNHIVVPNAVRYVGAQPIYVDSELGSYNMDLEQAEQRITPRTKALVLLHTFGIPANMDVALSLARRYGLQLIEDCVHALGAEYNGHQVGSFGRAAFFSTEETKTITSTMGGMAVTNDPELAAQLQVFQAGCTWPSSFLTARYLAKFLLFHLLTEPHLHRYTRPLFEPHTHRFTRVLFERFGNFRMAPGATSDEEQRGVRPTNYEQRLSNAQAALALRQLGRLDENLAHRRTAASAYHAHLSERGFNLPQPPVNAEPAYVRYPVWVEDRACTMRLSASHARLGAWFTSVLEEAVNLTDGDYEVGSCPRAEAIAKHLVNLPTHPRTKPQDIEAIVSALKAAASMRAQNSHVHTN